MADSKDAGSLAENIVHGTDQSLTTSAIPAGPNEAASRDDLADTINQVFALFRLNYHNQFYAAYADTTQLNQIKRLWLEALSSFTSESILTGAKRAIEDSDYLPTLKRMLDCCQLALERLGVPPLREAFIEACEKPSPKLTQTWSHPVVYFAGRDSDWFFLSNNAERMTLPVFKGHYDRWVARLSRGETIELPTRAELPEPETVAMSKEEQQQALNQLRAALDL
ncbi:replication protein P [Luminiphilus sp.]|nr:replication protein P [Luminiphilus sp.]